MLNQLHLEAVLFQGAAAAYMYPEYSTLLFQNQLVVDAVPVNPQQPLQGGIGIGHMQVGCLAGKALLSAFQNNYTFVVTPYQVSFTSRCQNRVN